MRRFVLSGSTAGAVERHCPVVLDFREAKEREDTHIFEAGTAAHAVLEAAQRLAVSTKQTSISLAALENLADDVVKKLTTEAGRDRYPLGITRALEGRDLALRHLRRQSIDGMAAFDPAEIPEMQITVDENWRVVPDDSATAAFSGRFDLHNPPHEETLDDGTTLPVVTLLDYKSAWPTDADELKSWQFKQYTLLMAAKYPNVAAIRRVVVNLRAGVAYDDLLWLDDDGLRKMDQWRRDLATIRAHVRVSPRTPSPGGGCIGCPYVLRCKHALHTPEETPESIAAALVASGAVYDSLMKRLKPMLSDSGSVTIPGGAYGYHEVQQAEPVPDVAAEVVGLLTGMSPNAARETHRVAVDAVAALNPGATNIRAALKRVYPAKGDAKFRKAEDERLLPKVPAVRFEFYRPKEDTD